MTSKQYTTFLRSALLAGSLYMFFEAIYHFSGVRLQGAEKTWPESAVAFIKLFMWLWASASFFMSIVLFYIYRYFEQSKPLLRLFLLPILCHTVLLLWLSQTPYSQILPSPNLYAWIPWYSWALRLEALTLFVGGGMIVYGIQKKYL